MLLGLLAMVTSEMTRLDCRLGTRCAQAPGEVARRQYQGATSASTFPARRRCRRGAVVPTKQELKLIPAAASGPT
jgi:hypothetical protein